MAERENSFSLGKCPIPAFPIPSSQSRNHTYISNNRMSRLCLCIYAHIYGTLITKKKEAMNLQGNSVRYGRDWRGERKEDNHVNVF